MPINLVADELTQPPFFRHWSAAEQEARAARQS